MLIPVWTTDGKNGLSQFRPDNPRVVERKNGNRNPDGTWPVRVIKYETPKDSSMRLDCPPVCREKLGDPSVDLWISEGVKKADSLASREVCAIGLLGVWNWRGRNDIGGLTTLADWEEIALNGRKVHIIFDNDVMRKPEVKDALSRFTRFLQNRGALVDHAYLPNDERKLGVDDWLAEGHEIEELSALIEAPRETPAPAPDLVELLDEAPATLARPLSLIDGVSYAATWLHVAVTKRETLAKNGEIIRHSPPIKTTEKRLFVIRNNGVIYGDGLDQGIESLGLEIHLPEIPRDDRLWSARGVKAYREGKRPNPADIFYQVAEGVSHFIDFDRSLGGQEIMSELGACFVLATYLLDAFSVAPYLWPSGERGSGKSSFLIVNSTLCFLGEFVTTGGSTASLRDLSDYGGMLAFDDAENVSDKRFDPDKRALLLSGNRRGALVTLKELAPDGRRWINRNVNVFCPRAFSAIRLPDPVLGSRSIIIPLIRSNDRTKTNIDPANKDDWPFDVSDLIDDLWALGLAYLPDLVQWDKYTGEHADLSGRNLQPWRTILAVAAWLDSVGVVGLWHRMNDLALKYHEKERRELEAPDLSGVVIRALVDVFKMQVFGEGWESSRVKDVVTESIIIETKAITDRAVKIIEIDELDLDPQRVTSARVGRALAKQRLEKSGHVGKARSWVITKKDILRFCDVYGLAEPDNVQLSEEVSDGKIDG